MDEARPNVVILAGPNGAGKSTIAAYLLVDVVSVRHFVNADTLARGLSAFHPEEMALKAGRVMLSHLHDLARERVDFAFETTLASRTFAPWLAELRQEGYRVHLFFVWLPAAELSIARVHDRVARGGHHVPDEVVRRRYERGIENFFRLYRPLAESWELLDNSKPEQSRTIAEKKSNMDEEVFDVSLWDQLRKKYAE